MLQLFVRRRRRHEHRLRLRDVGLGQRLRRHGDETGPDDVAAHFLAARHSAGARRSGLARRQSDRARPAPRLASPTGPPTRARAACLCRHRAGVHGLRRHLPPGLGQRLSRLDSGQRLQHGLRGDGLQPHGAAAARHPAAHAGGGPALGGRQGRVQQGTAGAGLRLRRGADHVRQPRHLQKRRQRDRRPARQVADIHVEIR